MTAVPRPDLPFLAGLPRHVGDLSPLECHAHVVLDRVARDGAVLTVTGWAVTRGLGVTPPTQLSALLVGPEGAGVEAPVVAAHLREAGLWGKQRYAAYEDGGFVLTVDTSALAPGRWHVEVETTYDGVTSAGPLAERVTGAELGGLAWDPSYGLTIGLPLGPPVPPVDRPAATGVGAFERRTLRDRILGDPPPLVDRVLDLREGRPEDPAAFFTAVATSRWVVSDGPLADDLAWWAPREGQRWVRVLTEAPALTALTHEGVALERLRVRRTWDLVALADPGWEAAVREEYGFEGTVVALADLPALMRGA